MFLPQVVSHRREVKLSLFWKMPECVLELTSEPRRGSAAARKPKMMDYRNLANSRRPE
jgi:hypothetical protein